MKTDVNREGHWLFISSIESGICFVKVTQLDLLLVLFETSLHENDVRYGRWKSDKAVDDYVKDDLCCQLSKCRAVICKA